MTQEKGMNTHGVVERLVPRRNHEPEDIGLEVDRQVADEAVTVALSCCARAGYTDLADVLLAVKAQTSQRWRREAA